MTSTARPDLTQLLSAPAGRISLLAATHGCFHDDRCELHLAWSPDGLAFRSSETDAQPDREQVAALLRRVIAAASLPEPRSGVTSTTVYEGALTWEIDGSADIESRGELRWSSRNIPAEEARAIVAELPPAKRPAHLELAPDPAHLLLAIARAPFPAG